MGLMIERIDKMPKLGFDIPENAWEVEPLKPDTLEYYRKTSLELRFDKRYNDVGKLNLACWLGERAHYMLAEIARLQAKIKELEEDA